MAEWNCTKRASGEHSVDISGKGTASSSSFICLVLCRWDNQKGAENICKQLGYSGGTWYRSPGGTGPIQAGNRLCSGGEATVWDCPLQAGMNDLTGCDHDHDIGVDCKNV